MLSYFHEHKVDVPQDLHLYVAQITLGAIITSVVQLITIIIIVHQILITHIVLSLDVYRENQIDH